MCLFRVSVKNTLIVTEDLEISAKGQKNLMKKNLLFKNESAMPYILNLTSLYLCQVHPVFHSGPVPPSSGGDYHSLLPDIHLPTGKQRVSHAPLLLCKIHSASILSWHLSCKDFKNMLKKILGPILRSSMYFFDG